MTSVWGKAGAGRGQLAVPKGVVVARDGSVWVVDYLNDKLIKYDTKAAVVLVRGGQGSAPGRFRQPSRVAVGPDGSVYVTDAGPVRVQVCRTHSASRFMQFWQPISSMWYPLSSRCREKYLQIATMPS